MRRKFNQYSLFPDTALLTVQLKIIKTGKNQGSGCNCLRDCINHRTMFVNSTFHRRFFLPFRELRHVHCVFDSKRSALPKWTALLPTYLTWFQERTVRAVRNLLDIGTVSQGAWGEHNYSRLGWGSAKRAETIDKIKTKEIGKMYHTIIEQ